MKTTQHQYITHEAVEAPNKPRNPALESQVYQTIKNSVERAVARVSGKLGQKTSSPRVTQTHGAYSTGPIDSKTVQAIESAVSKSINNYLESQKPSAQQKCDEFVSNRWRD